MAHFQLPVAASDMLDIFYFLEHEDVKKVKKGHLKVRIH